MEKEISDADPATAFFITWGNESSYVKNSIEFTDEDESFTIVGITRRSINGLAEYLL